MRALILGGSGQVGRALAATAPADAEAVCLDRAQCDVTDSGAIAAAMSEHRPDLVFNAAAYTTVDRAEEDVEAAWRVNAEAPAALGAATKAHGARFVHLSTDFVFGGPAERPRRPDDETGPESVYGTSKREGETQLLAICPDALVVRSAWVYGFGKPNFVAAMLERMAAGGEVRVVDDQIGTPTWAASLAAALWRLSKLGARGIHHFTDSGVASRYDLAVAVEEEGRAAGLISRPVRVVPIATHEYPVRARRPAFALLDKQSTWSLLAGPPPHWRVNLRAYIGMLARR